MREGNSGFSLLSLLVTMAIAAVLAVLLQPALQHARRAANAAKCAGNLRQIGTASALYSAEHRGEVVVLYRNANKVETYWTAELGPYLGSPVVSSTLAEPKVFVCPERPKHFGYGHNYYYLGWANAPFYDEASIAPIVRLSSAAHAATTLFLVDAISTAVPADAVASWPVFVRPPKYAGAQQVVDFRHPGARANVLWLDGHVTSEAKSPLMDSEKYWDPK